MPRWRGCASAARTSRRSSSRMATAAPPTSTTPTETSSSYGPGTWRSTCAKCSPPQVRSRSAAGNLRLAAPSLARVLFKHATPAASLSCSILARQSAIVLMPRSTDMAAPGRTAADLAESLLAGDKRALARAISLVENDDPEGWALVREVYPRTGRAAVVGFTGQPGVGKSTLIGRLVEHARGREREVAVLSIDPSSPFTQGALLGDRIRLTDHFLDPGVYIRSMASRGSLGGLSEATLQAALLMDASGKDDVFLETVGVGQAEVDIIDHADTVVLVLMPGSGDSIQALKAGVMEIPDIIVVNKADHPLTDTMVREVRGVLSLAPTVEGGWRVPIVKTEAARGEGVAELVEKLDQHRAYIEAEGTLSERRRRNLRSEVLALCTFRLRGRLEDALREDDRFAALLDEVVARRIDPASAASQILERFDSGAAAH